jgi:hypothetical protein
MTDKLSVWNGALAALGERRLASLTENLETRYVLEEIWDRDFVDTILAVGQWNFAGRTVKLDFAPSITPPFGYKYAFPKPEDFIRTMGVWTDEYLVAPLLQYQDEGQVWFAEDEYIYVRYVSNDLEWGRDYSLWPTDFTRWAETLLATYAAPALTHSDGLVEELGRKEEAALKRAKNTDAMEDPVKFPPKGRWEIARQGQRSTRDLGNRHRLLG